MPELHHQSNTVMERLLLNVLSKTDLLATVVIDGISRIRSPKLRPLDLIPVNNPRESGDSSGPRVLKRVVRFG